MEAYKIRQIEVSRSLSLGSLIQNWLLANQLSLNVLKTEYLYNCASDFNLANTGASNTDIVNIAVEAEPIITRPTVHKIS